MTSTSSVQDKIQVFINSHPEYEWKPLSEISSELVSAGVLTTEELGTLDSTSTFSIANKTPQKDDNVDSFEHAENTEDFQSTETTETIIEHGNEVIVKKKDDELIEKVIKEKIANSEEVRTITISYVKGKPFTKKIQEGDKIEEYLYSSETLESGEEVVAIKKVDTDGKSVEQTIAEKVDEDGNYTDEDFKYRKTLYLEDSVTGSNISVKAGSVKEVGKSKKDDLIEFVSDSTGEHVVTTQFNGGSVAKYDENNLYFKRQEIMKGEQVTNVADYDGKGNTYITIRNGDGPGTITKYFNDYIKRHGLDKSRQFTTADFERLNKKALSTTGLQVGKRALVPTQYNANAPILTKRGTPQQAMNRYAQFAFEQTKERLASSTVVETTLNKTYSSYEDLAREQLIAQGVHNPTKDQVNDRANELIALNSNGNKPAVLKKGAKISVVSNQASESDVNALKSAGLSPTFENNTFYKKFNSLNASAKQKVRNIINSCKGMKDINKVKAIVYESTGINLYDTNLTVNEYGTTSAVGMHMQEEFKQKMPLEYFLTKRMGLDLTSAKGKEVYNRMKSLSQAELDKISASQFTPEGVPAFGRSATGSIPISKNASIKDIIGTMYTQGVELRTSAEIRLEQSSPRYQERQRKEQAISMLYDSVKSAYDLINNHLEELKSHMISNAGEIVFEDLKIYGIPDVVKQLASYLSNGDGTVEGLTKSIYDKRDELQNLLLQINQLRNSKNFEADYKKLTGRNYNPIEIQEYMDIQSSLRNPVTRNIKTPKQLEQMQEQASNMFVKLVGGDRAHEAKKFQDVGATGGSVLEMAAMIYLTGGMGELGYIKNAGSTALRMTGSRAFAAGLQGALTLGTYTAGRESLNLIDDVVNAENMSELTVTLGDRGIKVLEHTGSSALFGFVGGVTAEKIFTMSKGAQNFISKGFSKIFGKGAEASEKAVSTFVADSGSGTGSVFTPSTEVVAAADKALGKGVELTGSQFISKAMMGAHSLNPVGKTVSIILETLTFSGVEISEQVALGLANELFTSESELKQAIANNTLDDYIKTKIKNAPESIINTLKEQGINMLMLKAVSFAVGSRIASNIDGQYETLDKSKVYKIEINGETKVVVETTNGKMFCNSTADAISFLKQAMTIETMIKSTETTKPENEFEWAQAAEVTTENQTNVVTPMSENLPVYTRANLPENAVVMPSTNLVISTLTNKPIGRLEVKQSLIDEARVKGFTENQIRLLEAKGLDANAINEYMKIGLKPVSTEVTYDGTPVDVIDAVPTTAEFDEVDFREDLESQTQHKTNNNPRFTDNEIDELIELRKKYPEVDNLVNFKKGIPLQLKFNEIKQLLSYSEKNPAMYNVVINNFDKFGLNYATEMLESSVTDAKDINFLENIAGLKGLNFRGEEAPMFSGEVMSKLTLLHQKDPVLAENLVERFKVTKDQTFVMQTINKISPSLYEKANELISEKETLADGTEQYALSSGQINTLMTVFEGSPEIAEKLKTIIQDKTIDDKVKSSFQKQLLPLLRETGVIKSNITRGGNEFLLATENLNHVKNPTTTEEQLLARTGISADFVVDKYAKKYGDNSFAKFSNQTISLLNDFYKTNKDPYYVKYVNGLLEGNLDENIVLEFLSKDDAGKKDILKNFFNTQAKINNTHFSLQSGSAKQALVNSKIPTNLTLMKMYNPESFDKLIHSKGFKMIQQGRMNVNVLSSVRPMDKVDDNYFYNMFEAKEQDFNARYESSTALKEYDKDMLFKIIDIIDPARQNEILKYIENAKDPKLMKHVLEKNIIRSVEYQESIRKKDVFELPKDTQNRGEMLIDLIRLTAGSPHSIRRAFQFNSTFPSLHSLASTELSVKLTNEEKDAVYSLFNEAHKKFKNITASDVQSALRFMEKYKDLDMLKTLTSQRQSLSYPFILSTVNENNIGLLKSSFAKTNGVVKISQLTLLEVLKSYPEMKDPKSPEAQRVVTAYNEVTAAIRHNLATRLKSLKEDYNAKAGEINSSDIPENQKQQALRAASQVINRMTSQTTNTLYTEAFNRKGLIDIKLKDPAKYERLKESGILDMVDSGELDSSILKHLNVNSDLTPEVYADLEAVKNGESIIPEFRKGTTIPYAFSKTKIGDAVAIGDKMYINDGKSLVEWKMTKEKYLELFPPVKRFLTQQRGLGDCYFVSSLTNSMYNPQARVGIYQSFEQNGNDVSVTIKDYNEYGGTKTYKDSKIDLDNRRLHVAGAKGIQMYEQTYARVALRDIKYDVTPMSDEWNSDYSMRRIAGGYQPVAMSEIHSTGAPQIYNEVPSDFKTGSISIYQITSEKLTNLLSRFGNKNDVMLGFGTNPKSNAKAESTLDSKYNLVSSHAYIIRGYNQEKGTVIINNPHNSGTNTEVPIDVLVKYMESFDITVLGDSQTNNASTKPQSVSSVESSEISALKSAERESADETITKITSLGIASLAINQKKNDKIIDSEYEECPEIVEGMSRFTPEELTEFSKHENYHNIELLSTLKFITPEGKEEYRYNAEEILQLANINNFEKFFVLAQKECYDPQTKKYRTRFSNDALKFFIRNKINFTLALKFGEDIKDINTGKTGLLAYHTIATKVLEYESNLKEIENGLKNIDDKELHTLFDCQNEDIRSFPIHMQIDKQKFLLKKIDAYNNLTNKYITYKQIDDKTSPQWLQYRKYCKDNNITINKDSYNDYIEQQRVESFIEACDKDDRYQPDPALTYMYEKIYLNNIPDYVSISPSDKEKLKNINKKYGVKIIIPTSEFREDKIDYIEREFENWKNATRVGGKLWGSLRLPPTINLLTAQKDYIDTTSAYGGSKSSACCYTDGSGKIEICDYKNIEWALRHELMHCADWKRLKKFPDSWYEADGKTIKSEIKNQLFNEFKKGNLNIRNKHFDYAFNNPREFIAVAAEGDIRKYSKNFMDLLMEFGMPNWAINLQYNY